MSRSCETELGVPPDIFRCHGHLDRHKRHLSQALVPDQPLEIVANSDGATPPLLMQLDIMIRHCERALVQAQANKSLHGTLRVIKEMRAYLELKCKVEAEERKRPALPKDRLDEKSRAGDTLKRPTADPYDRLEAIILQIHIRLARRKLGETAIITEPNNLQYLQEQYKALSARLEERELLKQSAGLATIPTCDERDAS